jgi:hypothetical protein
LWWEAMGVRQCRFIPGEAENDRDAV